MLLSKGAFISLLVAVSGAVASVVPTYENIEERASSAQLNATAFALTYAYPLLPFLQLSKPITLLVGSNKLYNTGILTNASNEVLVRPNVDTLYSAVALDLGTQNVELTIPEITDRFYVFPFYDVYGNNYANLGSINNTAPGTYLVRPTPSGAPNGFVVNTNASVPYKGYVNSPTFYGLILLRILVKSESDVPAVNAIQNAVGLREVVQEGTNPRLAPSLLTTFSTTLTGDDAYEYPGGLTPAQCASLLSLLARAVPYDNPENTADITSLNDQFATAGIHSGTYVAPAGINYTAASLMVNQTISATLAARTTYENYGNGWAAFSPSASGNFHTNYAIRAFIAWTGYLQLDTYIALYPEYNLSDTSQMLDIGPEQSLIYTFSGKPPVTGFWSLTAYGANQFLIANDLNRYALGDRSNITYADGTLVYATAAAGTSSAAADQTFQILMQPADVPPPANWTSNWIPAPKGGGEFSVNLRYYGPTDEIVGGDYVQPVVTIQDAIVDTGAGDTTHHTSGARRALLPLDDRGMWEIIAAVAALWLVVW